MYKITTDWHLHTEHSCDGACMRMQDLVAEQKQNGITDYGVTDHLHSLLQEDDIIRSRKAYDEALLSNPELKGHFHFGVEASVISQWQADIIAKKEYTKPPIYGLREGCPANPKPHIAADAEFCEKHGIDFVVTGVHWPLYNISTKEDSIKEYFRQYLFAASFPRTDVLAHFLWWNYFVREVDENPFLDFSVITESMRNELQSALIENNVAFELNLSGVLLSYPKTFIDEYMGWCSDLQHKGIALAIGSDNHAAHLDGTMYEKGAALLEHYGIDMQNLWYPKKKNI